MLVLMTVTCLSEYFITGPGFPYGEKPGGFEQNCRSSWWANLLYINNFATLSYLLFVDF